MRHGAFLARNERRLHTEVAAITTIDGPWMSGNRTAKFRGLTSAPPPTSRRERPPDPTSFDRARARVSKQLRESRRRLERATSRRRRRVLVLGDSHAAVFRHPILNGL